MKKRIASLLQLRLSNPAALDRGLNLYAPAIDPVREIESRTHSLLIRRVFSPICGFRRFLLAAVHPGESRMLTLRSGDVNWSAGTIFKKLTGRATQAHNSPALSPNRLLFASPQDNRPPLARPRNVTGPNRPPARNRREKQGQSGREGDRTLNPRLAKPVLSQLSYAPRRTSV